MPACLLRSHVCQVRERQLRADLTFGFEETAGLGVAITGTDELENARRPRSSGQLTAGGPWGTGKRGGSDQSPGTG